MKIKKFITTLVILTSTFIPVLVFITLLSPIWVAGEMRQYFHNILDYAEENL